MNAIFVKQGNSRSFVFLPLKFYFCYVISLAKHRREERKQIKELSIIILSPLIKAKLPDEGVKKETKTDHSTNTSLSG
jgi:hypothetical protein